MGHVLRKSVGPWSAGTAVIIRGDDQYDGVYTVEVQTKITPTRENGIDYEDLVFDIDKTDVVALRPRSGIAPRETRRQRRASKFKTEAFINNLIGGEK